MIKIKKEKPVVSSKEYILVLNNLKKTILQVQTDTILTTNKELIKLYWAIGKTIVKQQSLLEWGKNTIENLTQDLQNEFPGIAGFSARNVSRMQSFYLAYQEYEDDQNSFETLPIFNLPWGHNSVILEKIKNKNHRLWYIQKSLEYGWSRSALETAIKSKLLNREEKAITNFDKILPAPSSKLAQQAFKDPYIFDFLTLEVDHIEHDLEKGLVNNIEKLLLEMGKGFALVGRQYHLIVDEKDYYIDLIFYHIHLKCYVVVELKAREFDPKDAGQLNFYLSAIDDMVKQESDNPTIGLILCKTKKNFTAEYALRGIHRPIGVAEYETEIITKLPAQLKRSLPSVEEIEAELEKSQALLKKALTSIRRATKKATP